MKKRFLVAILAAITAASLMAACAAKPAGSGQSSSGSGESNSSKQETLTGEITVLTNRTDIVDTVFAKYATEFAELYPDAKVSFEALADYGDVTTRMSTDDYGDALLIQNSIERKNLPDFFAEMGDEKTLTEKYEHVSQFSYEGKTYGLSTGSGSAGFIYNDEVFKTAGIEKIPESTDEFFEVLKKIKDGTDAIPMYTNYAAAWPLGSFQSGIQMTMSGNPNWKLEMAADKEAFTKGKAIYEQFRILYEATKNGWVEEDPVTSDWEQSKQLLADGKLGVMCLGPWALEQIKTLTDKPENIKFMPAPMRVDGKALLPINSDFGMGVNKHSQNIELAKVFVEWFVNRYAQDSGLISPVKGAELPSYLQGIQNVEFAPENTGSAEEAARFTAVEKESLLSLGDPSWVKPIVEIGLGNSSQTFEDYMASLNDKWSKAIAVVEAQ